MVSLALWLPCLYPSATGADKTQIGPNDSQLLPLRLDKIVAILHSRLGSDVEVQDYYFLVDPTDHHLITPDGFPQLASLQKAFPGSNIRVVSLYHTLP